MKKCLSEMTKCTKQDKFMAQQKCKVYRKGTKHWIDWKEEDFLRHKGKELKNYSLSE